MNETSIILTLNGLTNLPKNLAYDANSAKCKEFPIKDSFSVVEVYPNLFDEYIAHRYDSAYMSGMLDKISTDFGIDREFLYLNGMSIGLRTAKIAHIVKDAYKEGSREFKLAVLHLYGKISKAEQMTESTPMENEEFRPIVNNGRYFNGEVDFSHYSVSNYGRLRYTNENGEESILKAYKAPTRKEMQFHLNNGDNKTCPCVHNMVADAFLGLRDIDTWQIIHIDGDWTNNRADNLMWVERKKTA